MFSKFGRSFFQGVVLGTMACLIYWYWQKSTQAEDGALHLLDRLKRSEDRLRQAETAVSVTPHHQAPEVLTDINGIGPIFAARLSAAGITTHAQVAQTPPDQLATLLHIHPGRAKRILNDLHSRR